MLSNVRTRWTIPAAALYVTAGLGLFGGEVRGDGVGSQAVVNLTFDESGGNAVDSAMAGAAKDNAALVNSPARVKSRFWGQASGQALVLDAAAKQFVQVADGPDTDRPDALSVSLYLVNLHPASEGAFHGLFAKRDDAKKNANYGANYSVQGDAFQLYVNDGSGAKVAVYGMESAGGYRRPTFLTATFQIGDAPAPDADEDKDDVLVRFFANGKPAAPKSATGGTVAGNDVWLTDVNVAGLLNDAPLTLGSSTPSAEFTSCIIDEFSLFAKALTAEEAAALFLEAAVPDMGRRSAETSPPPGPEIRTLSIRGLQSGQSNLLVISGANLQPAPQLIVPFGTDRLTLRPGATAERVEFEVGVAASVAAGHYPVRVRTDNGISGALTVAVDSLPQAPYVEGSADKPVSLPVAISGTLSGQQQHRVYFTGKSGQRIVIDLECKRLGSAMDPVLELRNARGAPFVIAWGRPQYRGDTRIDTTLFADGQYSVDLHDLAFNAPGQNDYRLKIGELKIVDTTFPPAVAPGGQQTVEAIGPGMDSTATLPVGMQNVVPGVTQTVSVPPTMGVVGPAPSVVISDSVEVLEAAQPENQLQTVDARFAERAHVPVVVNGRISRPSEIDRYLLQVTPGMTLHLSAESHAIRSPLDARLMIVSHPEGAVLAASEERPAVEFPVPAGVTTVEVNVRDLNRRGGADYVYRLRFAAAGQPDFSLAIGTERVTLTRDGTALVRVDVNRAGYNGPIALALEGASDLSITPAEIPAGATKAFVLLTARSHDGSPEALVRRVRLTGQSAGLEPPLRRAALTPMDDKLSLVPAERAELTAALRPPAGAAIDAGPIPVTVFKGTEASLPVAVRSLDSNPLPRAVRLTLVTTEAPRTAVDPTDPARQRRVPLPLLRNLPEQTLGVGESSGTLRISVPSNVAEAFLECAVRADIVSDPFSDRILATVYSAPFRLNIQSAVTVQPAANALTLASKAQTKFSGTLKRAAGFSEPVEVSLVNLPAGYSASKATVAPDQEQFEIVVTAPEVTAAADIPRVAYRVTTTSGVPLQDEVAVPTKATPAP